MRNVSDKSCRENQNTRFVFQKFIFGNRAVYEIMWKKWQNRASHRWQYGARALHAGYTHREYGILIAFPLQQWLHERSTMLRYTHITCLGKAVSTCSSSMRFSLTVFRLELHENHVCLMHVNCLFHRIVYSVILCNVIFFGHELIPLLPYPRLENHTLSALLDRLYRTIFVASSSSYSATALSVWPWLPL
jgi:hypothetical protein